MAETPEIRGGGEAEGIDLPTPTAWPMIFALGLALLFAGLVTHIMVSCVGGALFFAGAVGWWFQVLPVEQHERVPLQAERRRPLPIEPQATIVEHLRAGEQGHRLLLPIEMQPYSSGFRGGAAGGVAMAAVAMLYGLFAEGSVFYPINLLASAMMPSMNLADAEALRSFDAAALATATLMHVGLSMLVGLVYAALLPALSGRTWLWGGIVAPIVWTGVAWVSLGIVAPALNAHIQWGWFIASQAAFGLSAGFVISRIEPVALLQRMDFAERAGIETAGVVRPHDEPEGDE